MGGGVRVRAGRRVELTHLDGGADDVEAHGDDVLRGGAVIARADEALERGGEVAALIMEVAEVIVAHANRLLHQRGLVRVQVELELVQALQRLAVHLIDPRVVGHHEAVARCERQQLAEYRRVRASLRIGHRHAQRVRLVGRRG